MLVRFGRGHAAGHGSGGGMSAGVRMYRVAWRVALKLGIPRLVLRNRTEELAERMGQAPVGGESSPVWIHAASVGELGAAEVLIRAMRARSESIPIAVSTMTRTGRERAEALNPDFGPFHLPFDAPGPVACALDRLCPRALLLVETELWPELLGQVTARGIPWGIVSGRISPGGFRRARWAGPIYREMLGSAGAVAARTEEDAARFRALGGRPDGLRVTGDLKDDRVPEAYTAPDPDSVRWAAACTRPGEEEIVLEALALVAERMAAPGELLLAPRHPNRFEDAARLAEEAGWRVRRWEDRTPVVQAEESGWSVTLVDRMGVLPEVYRRACVAFIGGSLVPLGGHTPTEAAAGGRPVLVGPHTETCEDAVARLERVGAARRVDGAQTLADEVCRALLHPDESAAEGRRAWEVAAEGTGAAADTVAFLRERGVLR
ncbi:MAG: glycosyltransferase N-terminal domain-containing protein [Gemmatimonadota bacterium]|nr:glycosyltransferase N-terminal domain-containing protein [Gemmatimonadota bacterium]